MINKKNLWNKRKGNINVLVAIILTIVILFLIISIILIAKKYMFMSLGNLF